MTAIYLLLTPCIDFRDTLAIGLRIAEGHEVDVFRMRPDSLARMFDRAPIGLRAARDLMHIGEEPVGV